MKGALFMFGRAMQIAGIVIVLVAFLGFFGTQNMGRMFKLTLLGLVEFYVGYFIVAKTGEKDA